MDRKTGVVQNDLGRIGLLPFNYFFMVYLLPTLALLPLTEHLTREMVLVRMLLAERDKLEIILRENVSKYRQESKRFALIQDLLKTYKS